MCATARFAHRILACRPSPAIARGHAWRHARTRHANASASSAGREAAAGNGAAEDRVAVPGWRQFNDRPSSPPADPGPARASRITPAEGAPACRGRSDPRRPGTLSPQTGDRRARGRAWTARRTVLTAAGARHWRAEAAGKMAPPLASRPEGRAIRGDGPRPGPCDRRNGSVSRSGIRRMACRPVAGPQRRPRVARRAAGRRSRCVLTHRTFPDLAPTRPSQGARTGSPRGLSQERPPWGPAGCREAREPPTRRFISTGGQSRRCAWRASGRRRAVRSARGRAERPSERSACWRSAGSACGCRRPDAVGLLAGTRRSRPGRCRSAASPSGRRWPRHRRAAWTSGPAGPSPGRPAIAGHGGISATGAGAAVGDAWEVPQGQAGLAEASGAPDANRTRTGPLRGCREPPHLTPLLLPRPRRRAIRSGRVRQSVHGGSTAAGRGGGRGRPRRGHGSRQDCRKRFSASPLSNCR